MGTLVHKLHHFVGYVVECIRAGGINVTDIKGHVDTAGIPRIKAAKIITDVEAVSVSR